jgi:hypothetical protein
MTYTNHKYQFWNTKAQSWEHIEDRFITDWGGTRTQMLQLVRHIKNLDLSKRIFGSTSMDKLVISNCDPFDYRKEALHITFDLDKKLWHFEYKEQPYQNPKFVRDYAEEVGIEKFDNFIKMIHW